MSLRATSMGSVLLASIACSGLVAGQPPVEPSPAPTPSAEPVPAAAAPPSTARPALVLWARPAPDCALVWVSLPDQAERVLDPFDCDVDRLTLAPDGTRAMVGTAVFDLQTGAFELLPVLPDEPGEQNLHFTRHGGVFLQSSWGEDEIGFEEGPVYARYHDTIHSLAEGAWYPVAQRVYGQDIAPDNTQDNAHFEAYTAAEHVLWTCPDCGSSGDWVPRDAPLHAQLDQAGSLQDADWSTAGSPPRVAWQNVQYGEAMATESPVLVDAGAGWQRYSEIPDGSIAIASRGKDWLLVTSSGTTTAFDLTSGQSAWKRPGTAWFWPEGVAVPR